MIGLWLRLLRLAGHRTFVRRGVNGDMTYLAARGNVRGIFVERLESLGFVEDGPRWTPDPLPRVTLDPYLRNELLAGGGARGYEDGAR